MNTNSVFEKDLYRYGRNKKLSFSEWVFLPLQIKYLYYFRKVQSTRNRLLRRIYTLKLMHISNISHIQIP